MAHVIHIHENADKAKSLIYHECRMYAAYLTRLCGMFDTCYMKREFVEQALVRKCGWHANTLIPEVEIQYPDGICRADFICISVSGYATEFEVKSSSADWEHDKKKIKWRHPFPPYIKRFIYVAPASLKIPDWINASAGVWQVNDDGAITIARRPQILCKQTVTDAQIERWKKNLYYRYWDLRYSTYLREALHDA